MNLPTRTNGEKSAQARSPRIVSRCNKGDPFARVDKEMLDDPNLSWRAKGILAYLLGKPGDWKVRVNDLRNKSKEGRDAVRNTLNELRRAGYAKLEAIRDEQGKHVEWIWNVSDAPVFKPLPEKPEVAKPEVGFQYHTKKDSTENEVSKNESKETRSSPVGDVSLSSDFKPLGIFYTATKQEKLKRIRRPRNYPTELEFDAFIQVHDLCGINAHRPDLYSELCRHKWHYWNPVYDKWVRILDWKSWIIGLNKKMFSAF